MVNWKNKQEVAEYNKRYRETNVEKIKRIKKAYRLKNLQKEHEYGRRWRQLNKDKCKIRLEKWRERNPEKNNEYNRKYYKINPQKFISMQKDYRKRNPEKYSARYFSSNHKLRGESCKGCGELENLHFHHTNYKINEGLTLCRKCHSSFHNQFAEDYDYGVNINCDSRM